MQAIALTDDRMNDITYEQPLNERIRTLMRLEHLFHLVDHGLTDISRYGNRSVLSALVDILHSSARADLKTDIIKELERLSNNLSPLANSPDVDQAKLRSILDDLQDTEQQFHALQGLFAQELRDNEFINSFKQRCSVPGGSSDFDIPSLHCWLRQGEKERLADLNQWLSQLTLLRQAIGLIMTLIRESARTKQTIATAGLYQQPLDSHTPFQLVRVTLPLNVNYFPEISGGKHRITIRFLSMTTTGRPTQVEQDIDFTLANCVI